MRHLAAITILCLNSAAPGSAVDGTPPEEVSVRPVFFVPTDQPPPTGEQMQTLLAHLDWARTRYAEMLACRDTFRIDPAGVQVVTGALPIEAYQGLFEGGVPHITAELLAHFGVTRFNAPHVYLTIVMNTEEDWPPGGGRPLNGGYDTGGGVLVMSSRALDQLPNFQSTLQHELGHAFGLPHVAAYGYSMRSNASIMSYNLDHHTDFFEPSDTPGILIPEDVRGLAFNDRVFPRLAFDPDTDIPGGYEIRDPVWLGPMMIPGQLPYDVAASTPSGEAFGSSVEHVIQNAIAPNAGPGVTFDPATMWHSDPVTPGGWVELTLEFPHPVELDTVRVHSQHSGLYHRAEALRLTAISSRGEEVVVTSELDSADHTVTFDPVTADRWRFRLRSGESGSVVIRGFQLFGGGIAVFPPLIPPEPGPASPPACPSDLDASGLVDVGDLLRVLAAWGPAPGAAADLDHDCLVGQADLLRLLSDWGPCDG